MQSLTSIAQQALRDDAGEITEDDIHEVRRLIPAFLAKKVSHTMSANKKVKVLAPTNKAALIYP